MSFKLREFVLENFNSYLGSHKISFKEKQGNLVLIKGIDEFDKSSNGTGKSTIVDAIVFTFFGRSLKKELNLDDLISKHSDKPLKTDITFEDSSDGKVINSYRIERTRSKAPAYSQCVLYENGKCVSNNLTNTEIQSKIEQIIGMDYQMFVNNNVLNPELFRFVKGNSSQKIDILERVLNLNIVSKIFFTLSNVVKEDAAVHQKNDHEYYALKTSLDNLVKQEESVNKNVQENIDILTNKNEELEKEISEIKMMREAYDAKINVLHSIVEKKQTELNRVSEEKIKLDHGISEQKKRIKYYEKNEKCHACGQTIPNHEVILANEKAKLEEFKDALKLLTSKTSELKDSPEFKEYNKLVSDCDDFTRKIKEKNFQISQNKRTIEKFSSITSEASKIDEIREKAESAELEYIDSKSKLEITEFWREMLVPKSKTRMTLAGDLLKVLNVNIQKYVSNFYNKDFHFHFSINDNNINETITINGEKFKYDQLSSGEKQKIDIVIVLSLLDIAMTYFKNNKLKFLIIDEATDHLDNVWARYVIEFIKLYAINLNMMVLFISHHSVIEELDSLFDNTITAVKGLDGNSYIAKSRVY